MRKRIPSIGEFEALVMRLVWQAQPCTQKEIDERVQKERPVARTTVLKTIQRLEQKGLLIREKGSSPIRYRAAIARKKALPALIRRFVEQVLGGSSEPLVAYLAQTEGLSEKDLKALRDIAARVAKDQPSTAAKSPKRSTP